jgi:hypothetical protein
VTKKRGISKRTSSRPTRFPVGEFSKAFVTRPVLHVVLYVAKNPSKSSALLSQSESFVPDLLTNLSKHHDWSDDIDREDADNRDFTDLLARLCPCFNHMRDHRMEEQFERHVEKWDEPPSGQLTCVDYNQADEELVERLRAMKGWKADWTADLVSLLQDGRIGGRLLI